MEDKEPQFQGGIGMKTKAPLTVWKWSEVVQAISTGKIQHHDFLETNTRIRKSLYKSEEVRKQKSLLPFIILSVKLGSSDLADQNIVHHNGFGQLDFDLEGINDMFSRSMRAREVKAMLKGDPYISLLVCSPQWGVKVVIKIPANVSDHNKYIHAAAKYFKEKYGLIHDPACVGPKRLMFLPYDPDPIQNLNSLTFDLPPSDIFSSPQQSGEGPQLVVDKNQNEGEFVAEIPEVTKLDLEYSIRFIEENKIDITANQGEWHSMGMACASLGEAGRDYFHRVSQFHPTYTSQKADKEFNYDLSNSNGSINIGTLFHYFIKHGVPLRPKLKHEVNQGKGIGERPGSNEQSILSETPTFDPGIYDNLPPLLSWLSKLFSQSRSRDMVLVSALPIIGAAMPKVYGMYDGKKIHPFVFVFVVAPPASRKSVVSWSKRLGSLIEGYLVGLWKTAKEEHLASDGAANEKPVPSMFFVPGNVSAAGLLQLVSGLETGVIWETEADTLNAIMAADFGNWMHHLRDIFDHATAKAYRKTNMEFTDLENPKLSVLLTGTPSQFIRLLNDNNGGIHSRFIIYGFEEKPTYHSPFSSESEKYEEAFNLGAKEIFDLFNAQRTDAEIRFTLTKDQHVRFDRVVANWMDQSYRSHENKGSGISTRFGEIMFRICMILTGLRTKCKGDMICSDIDFETSVRLIEAMRVHSLSSLSLFPQPVSPITSEVKAIERFFQSLPQNFTSREVVARHDEFGASERTIQRYLKQLREKSRITLDANGLYTKR